MSPEARSLSSSVNSLNAAARKLPIHAYKESFLRLLADNQSLVVVGETGSGKTTQIPQWCHEYLAKDNNIKQCVACTQPRRIAAMSVSSRVAKEMGVQLGEEVGYSVRFDSMTSSKTVLKYLTDGMLLREAIIDGLLLTYRIILLDEAHERTLQTEMLFGVIRRALTMRNDPNSKYPNLKVIVMSATIDVKLFKGYFNCPVLVSKGRQYQVRNMFATVPQSDLLTSCLTAVFQLHRTCNPGDILVFCSGQDEIQTLVSLCRKISKELPESLRNLIALPLYASLPANCQMKVFEPSQVTNGAQKVIRRVIFSTNVAETSITIPDIKYVIDTGMFKCRTYCPKTGLESLKVNRISKAQASQRSGRAGRIDSGTCYRLYTRSEYEAMSDHLSPEIQRCNLDGVILQIISIGIKNLNTFEFLQRPNEEQLRSALRHLIALKSITKSVKNQTNGTKEQSQKVAFPISDGEDPLKFDYELTKLGKKLSTFPLSPSMSRILIAADDLGCLDEALTIISLLYVENIFHILPNQRSRAESMLEKFQTNEGDLIMLLRIFRAFKKVANLNRTGLKGWCNEHFIHTKNLKLAVMVRKQLLSLCKTSGMSASSCGQDTEIVRKAFVYGLFNNIAQMWNGKYRNKDSTELNVHPSSCLFKSKPECIMYVELVETNKPYMRNCSLIDIAWVRELQHEK